MTKNKAIFKYLIIFFVLFFIKQGVFAQQTIISVPSSEVLPSGDIIIKDSNRFDPFYPNESLNITPNLIFGTGKGTEASIGASTAIDEQTTVRADIGFKKVFFIKNASRFTVGTRLNPYLSGEKTMDTMVYSHLSYRIRKTRTSITAGGYVASRKNYLPNKGGVLFGVEQVIIPNKLRLAVDWLSGEDSFSVLGVGLKYRPVPTLSITSAIIIPNKDADNIGFNISLSKFISIKDFQHKKKGDL